MRTILCYGDSNTWGCPPILQWPIRSVERYAADSRWGGVLRAELGAGYAVVEEGLGGRTTVWDDPIDGEHRNGKKYLPACLESHSPIDLVALMLGTNDLKRRFSLAAADVAEGAGVLIGMIGASGAGPGGAAPKVLLICPPPLGPFGALGGIFAGAEAASAELAGYYARVAADRGAAFLDAGKLASVDFGDGVHLQPDGQRKLGRAVAAEVRRLLGS